MPIHNMGMSNTATDTPAPDLVSLLSQLTLADVHSRLDAIEAERKALLVLIRSLRARERAAARQRREPIPAKGGAS
jgi:hypothetical protein